MGSIPVKGPYAESVLMVGSVPLPTVKDVFARVCESLGDRLHAVPDGEVGNRYYWILFQLDKFPLEARRTEYGGAASAGTEKGIYTVDSIKPTLYDEAALSSYAEFVELRKQGVIPANVKFQISLPTPIDVVLSWCKPEFHAEMEPLYEARLAEAIARIVEEIPHNDLVIQWDMPLEQYLLEYERGTLESQMPFEVTPFFTPVKEGILERMARICNYIPSDVGIGIHHCYGDMEHKHWMEPNDTSLMVEFANSLVETLGQTHSLEWVHMPVPRSRIDSAYFEPLKDLRLGTTRLYLGLVHPNDEEGTWERIKQAQSFYPHPFGVATECGMGRTPPEDIDSILAISKAVTQPRSETKI